MENHTRAPETEPPLVVAGMGGHGFAVAELAEICGRSILGYTDDRVQPNVPWRFLGSDREFLDGTIPPCLIAIGVGISRSSNLRTVISGRFSERSLVFCSLVHPSAVISPSARIASGVQVFAQAVIHSRARIGSHVIVNSGACIEHDVTIGEFVHVAPNAVLLANVAVGERAFIGANATIRQGIKIGADATVGAGAVVIDDVPNGATVMGVPARIHRASV